MKKNPNIKVTQNDVARRAGVTRSMVSYVLNGSSRSVAPETREKILDAIKELGYRPNKFAQALRSNKGDLADEHIGIVLCSAEMFLRPYYTEMLAGIHSAAHENGFHIRFIRFFDELKDPILFNQLIHSEEICGLLLVAIDQCLETPEDWQLIERIQVQIEQIVCVDWQMPGLSSVSFDRQAAALQAANYLFDQGYRDIVYIGESDQRVAGFKQAFLEQGEKDISGLYIDAAADMASGYLAVQRLHKNLGAMPKAICAGCDEVAVGILHYLHEQGIAVPSKTAVISIDNIEIAGYTNPQLTTMNVQKLAIGYRAVEMIVNRSADCGENALTLLLPVNLVIRKSA
ncbi:MAG: LacI family transcriptional regulator [Treponema sp.]|nr:LacI family transcriptional regulator [Treponema sp.]